MMKQTLMALVICTSIAGSAMARSPIAQCIQDNCSGLTGSARATCNQNCQNANPGDEDAVCTEAPTVAIWLSQTTIWPPNHKSISVGLSGQVTQPAGCTQLTISCQLTDEYGAYSGPVSVSGGASFTGTSYVEAWRLGQDMDGRAYSYVCTATNEVGTGTSNAAMCTVPHDQRP